MWCEKGQLSTSVWLKLHSRSDGFCRWKLVQLKNISTGKGMGFIWSPCASQMLLCSGKKVDLQNVNYCMKSRFWSIFRYSLLPALSMDGMIYAKIVEGSFTAELFQEFISSLLDRMQPFPAANSVIVMDNTQIHKNQDIIHMIHAQWGIITIQYQSGWLILLTVECVCYSFHLIRQITTL